MLGFSWGFVARGGEITLVPPRRWTAPTGTSTSTPCGTRHPGWHFSPGLADLA